MNYHKINSPISRVLWAGWESDTLSLQKNGWQISMEQDVCHNIFRAAVKHPNFRMYGISKTIPYFEVYNKYKDGQFIRGFDMPIIISHMASRLDVQIVDNLSSFMPIDAEPSIISVEKKNIEDFMIFKPIGKAKEIIVDPSEVPELLELVLKKQSPKQQELREKKRKQWRKFTREINEGENMASFETVCDNRTNIVAQLVSI